MIKRTIINMLLIITLLVIVITLLNSFDKSPTFREYCEANNGIYIENHGKAGNSCIYRKGSEE